MPLSDWATEAVSTCRFYSNGTHASYRQVVNNIIIGGGASIYNKYQLSKQTCEDGTVL